MKYIVIIALVFFSPTFQPIFSQAPNPVFKIEGAVVGHPEWAPKLYISKLPDYSALFSGADRYIVDSVDIRQERFQLEIPVSDSFPVMFRLTIPRLGDLANNGLYMGLPFENYMHFLATPGGSLQFLANADNFTCSFACLSGSPENRMLSKIQRIRAPFMETAREAYAKMQHAARDTNTNAQQVRAEVMGKMLESAANLQQQLGIFLDSTRLTYSAAIAIFYYNYDENKVKYYPYFRQMIDDWKAKGLGNQYLNALRAEIDEFENYLPIGSQAPDITVLDTQGRALRLYEVEAPLLLIDFWASWCGPCRNENTTYVKPLYAAYHKAGFEIFGVSFDTDRQKWETALRKDGYNWLNGSDGIHLTKSDIAQTYKLRGVPTTYLLDKNKKIIAKNLRGETLKNFVENYFKK